MITMSVNDAIVWRREVYAYFINGHLIYLKNTFALKHLFQTNSTNMLYE